MSLSLAVTVVA